MKRIYRKPLISTWGTLDYPQLMAGSEGGHYGGNTGDTPDLESKRGFFDFWDDDADTGGNESDNMWGNASAD